MQVAPTCQRMTRRRYDADRFIVQAHRFAFGRRWPAAQPAQDDIQFLHGKPVQKVVLHTFHERDLQGGHALAQRGYQLRSHRDRRRGQRAQP
ncbi:hypothetical protein D3C87_1967570 [compost metagenome]